MIKSVRHLRGTRSQWESYDAVIPDGEIAILKSDTGLPKIKIGNGADTFSALPSISGDAVSIDGGSVTLLHGRSYRLGEVSELTVNIPSTVDEDYYAEISFDSGKDATELVFNKRVRLTGDGVADEELMPRAKTHYTLFIWYDGELQGIVRGLPNA